MAGEFDTKGDMNLSASDAGKMTASENLFDAAHRDVSQQTAGSDKTAIGDGNVRGFTPADARVCTDIENAQFAATLIQMSQRQVEAKIAGLQAA